MENVTGDMIESPKKKIEVIDHLLFIVQLETRVKLVRNEDTYPARY